MKIKNCLSGVLFLVLWIMMALFLSPPVRAAETADTKIDECWVDVYVADTDPRGVNVRSGPGQSYPVVATLPYHDVVTISGAAGEWMRVTKPNYMSGGDDPDWNKPIGWVSGKLLAVTATTGNGPELDPSGLVPIRGELDWNTAIIAWVPQNTEFRIIGCAGECVKVRYRDVEGWLLFFSFEGEPPYPSPASGEAKTAGIEVIPCDNVAAYVVDNDPKGVNIRSGPDTDYPSIATLPTDRPVQVTITGAIGDWVLIKDPIFRSKEKEMTMKIAAWVNARLLGARTKYAGDPSGFVILYKDMSAESAVVAEIPRDTEAAILECRGGWLKVQIDKQEGWLGPGSSCGNPFRECPY